MPSRLKFYRDLEKLKEYRKRGRKSNYIKGRIFSNGEYRPYTNRECRLILAHKIFDRELARILKRSVQAIQIMRCRLKKGKDVK